MKLSGAERTQRHRDQLRHRGLRPIQIWVPDTRLKGFVEECSRQARLARDAEGEHDVMEFIEHTSDLEGWK